MFEGPVRDTRERENAVPGGTGLFGEDGPEELRPFDLPKAPEVLADYFRRKILSGSLRTGEVLPPERILVEKTGMGRSTVREALRTLAGEGLVATRTGRYGGWVVLAAQPESVVRSVDAFIKTNSFPLTKVMQVRSSIEPACAELAAMERTAQDLDALNEISERLVDLRMPDKVKQFHDVNLEWHLAVATASHNRILDSFMRAVSGQVRRGTADEWSTVSRRDLTIRAHERVMRFIREGDAENARASMATHLHAYIDVANSELTSHGQG